MAMLKSILICGLFAMGSVQRSTRNSVDDLYRQLRSFGIWILDFLLYVGWRRGYGVESDILTDFLRQKNVETRTIRNLDLWEPSPEVVTYLTDNNIYWKMRQARYSMICIVFSNRFDATKFILMYGGEIVPYLDLGETMAGLKF